MFITLLQFILSLAGLIRMAPMSHLNISYHPFLWLSNLLLPVADSSTATPWVRFIGLVLITWPPKLHLVCIVAAAASLVFVLRICSCLIRSRRVMFSVSRSVFNWQVCSLKSSIFVGAHVYYPYVNTGRMHIYITSFLDSILMVLSKRRSLRTRIVSRLH